MPSPFWLRVARVTMHGRFVPPLAVTRLDVPVRELPAALDGLTIAHISDLHVGEGAWMPFHLERVRESIAREQPDLLFNTGDFLQGDPSLVRVEEVARRFVLPPGPDGMPRTFAVLGNHDYYAGAGPVKGLHDILARAGVRLLDNEVISIAVRDTRVTIAGLNEHEPGMDEALGALPRAKRPALVLVHEPDVAERLPDRVADLVVAGHTHGGQILLPGMAGWIVRRFSGSRYSGSRYIVNGNSLYINRGLGCTGVPLRWRANPELTFFRLRR